MTHLWRRGGWAATLLVIGWSAALAQAAPSPAAPREKQAAEDEFIVQVFGPPDAVSCRTERRPGGGAGGAAGQPEYILTCRPPGGRVEVQHRDATASGRELVYNQTSQKAVLAGDVTFRRPDAEGAAQRIEIDGRAAVYTLSGNVRLTQGGRTAAADRVVYDQANQAAELTGNVRLVQQAPALSFTAARIQIDFKAETLAVYGAPVEFRAPVQGDQAER